MRENEIEIEQEFPDICTEYSRFPEEPRAISSGE
jgi:hypothetical protein